jgi:hypothetical protein
MEEDQMFDAVTVKIDLIGGAASLYVCGIHYIIQRIFPYFPDQSFRSSNREASDRCKKMAHVITQEELDAIPVHPRRNNTETACHHKPDEPSVRS